MKLKTINRLYIIILIIGALIAFAGAFAESTLLSAAGILIICADMVLRFILIRCPYCGRFLDRSSGGYCPHCGQSFDER